MSKDWQKVKLGDVVELKRGYDLPRIDMVHGKYPVIGSNSIIGYHNIFTTKAPFLSIGRSGNVGNPFFINQDCWAHNTCLYVKSLKNATMKYIYYLFQTLDLKRFAGGSAVPTLNRNHLSNIEILLPPLEEQERIAEILSSFDDKIENNKKICSTLEEMARLLFRENFIKNPKRESWDTVKLGDVADITIGRTPPTKEKQWFTTGCKQYKWISIKDMGESFTYIGETKQQLTPEAVNKFRIPIIPKDTVILSFKLTVGRVLFTSEDNMISNEAIAHIKLSNEIYKLYIYFTLKIYNYHELGSTSSIATAINSKIIKAMPIILPPQEHLEEFEKIVTPMYEQIKILQKEIITLTTTRDILLPRLMKGEV